MSEESFWDVGQVPGTAFSPRHRLHNLSRHPEAAAQRPSKDAAPDSAGTASGPTALGQQLEQVPLTFGEGFLLRAAPTLDLSLGRVRVRKSFEVLRPDQLNRAARKSVPAVNAGLMLCDAFG